MKKYYEIIKEIREDNDISQKEMGKMLGVSQNTVSQYELGIRTLPIDILEKYVKIFNISADYILGLTKISKPNWENNENITNKSVNINQGNNNINNIKIK